MTPAEAYWLVAKYVNGHFINDVKTFVHREATYVWLCENGEPVVNVTRLDYGQLDIDDLGGMTYDQYNTNVEFHERLVDFEED